MIQDILRPLAAFAVSVGALVAFFALWSWGDAAPARELPLCPPLGTTTANGALILSAESYFGGTWPMGRRFVVVDCRR